ncbi:phage tail protein [Brevibacillus sp. SYSU BS000544]|uniref:phage tail protein n=1 Tax=Brevibacillus sp. SYSU BS000544 TaxID=3416443 RepID=UPI003CE57BEA
MAYLGEIRMFAGNYAPAGWAFCDGTELSIAEYSELFAIIGTAYGGNGQDTFALPNLRGRVPVHAGTNNATGTNYTLGQEGGVEDVTLTSNQIPAHTHTPLAVTQAGLKSPAGNIWATLPFTGYSTVTTSLQPMKNTAIQPSGGSQPHSNMMPSLSIHFIICLYGEYPIPN